MLGKMLVQIKGWAIKVGAGLILCLVVAVAARYWIDIPFISSLMRSAPVKKKTMTIKITVDPENVRRSKSVNKALEETKAAYQDLLK